MCICLIAIEYYPDYPLIVLSNRDEFFLRPTLAAHFWEDDNNILGGKDLKDKGTWLGVSKLGKFGILTNYRHPDANDPTKKTRGELIINFLKNNISPKDYLTLLKSTKHLYNGYNIIFGTFKELIYYNNFFNINSKLKNGVNVLSNGTLNDTWPKCRRLKELFIQKIQDNKINPSSFFEILTDTYIFEDHELPNTGVGILKERFLSPIFILGKEYGTRTSTVILLDTKGNLQFIERTYIQGTSEVDFEKHFALKIN